MISLPKGTKEFVIVDVDDRLNNLIDLAPTLPTYDIRPLDGTYVVQGFAASPQLMRLFCLVDTTTLPEGEYELFVQFNTPPESPRIGPIKFEVEA